MDFPSSPFHFLSRVSIPLIFLPPLLLPRLRILSEISFRKYILDFRVGQRSLSKNLCAASSIGHRRLLGLWFCPTITRAKILPVSFETTLPVPAALFRNFSRRNVSRSSTTHVYLVPLFPSTPPFSSSSPPPHPILTPNSHLAVVRSKLLKSTSDVFLMLVKRHPKSCHSIANESTTNNNQPTIVPLTILRLRNGDVCYFCFGQRSKYS